MLIDRISRLRNCCVFRDFTWPGDLPDFKRFNLIYGWNASGKTTISRLFRALEQREAPTKGHVSVRINGTDIEDLGFGEVALPIRVFNRDFVNDSVFPVGGGEVPPIYVVGKESVTDQKAAETLKSEREDAAGRWQTALGERRAAERELDKLCQDRAREIKDHLRSPGANPYNNYDKSDFQRRAEAMLSAGNANQHRLADDARASLRALILSSPKPELTELAYHVPDTQQMARDTANTLETTVFSAVLASLKEDPQLADWTRRGLHLHRERKEAKCLFCGQPLPPGRLQALEAHFTDEYERFQHTVDEQITGFHRALKDAAELDVPRREQVSDDLADDLTVAEDELRRVVGAATAFVRQLIGKLEDKRRRPFDRISLDICPPPAATSDPVAGVNSIIRRHNATSNDFNNRLAEARDRLALDSIAQALDDFLERGQGVRSSKETVEREQAAVTSATARIAELEARIVEHRKPAERLNSDLREYLGHGELQFTVKDTGYSVTRNGEPADMLSEGERTAIALLYFLQSLDDRSFDPTKGVVVLDDPVCSLDQNAMFAAFGHIRARTQHAGQLIILTHSFMFFRLVLGWFRRVKKQHELYMLESGQQDSRRVGRICALDPLLRDFESEYHYLFACLYRMANAPSATALESYYYAPSVARRVVETFLAFRFPTGGREKLWGQIEAAGFDRAKSVRIYRFLQTHAHRDVIGDGDEDLTLLAESRAVLNDVLGFMRAVDADHVEKMVELVACREMTC